MHTAQTAEKLFNFHVVGRYQSFLSVQVSEDNEVGAT